VYRSAVHAGLDLEPDPIPHRPDPLASAGGNLDRHTLSLGHDRMVERMQELLQRWERAFDVVEAPLRGPYRIEIHHGHGR
jgi:hypothetical protein